MIMNRIQLFFLFLMQLVGACSVQNSFDRPGMEPEPVNEGLVLIGPVCETGIECQSELSKELLLSLDQLVKRENLSVPEEMSDQLFERKLERYDFAGQNNDQWVLYRENYSSNPEKVVGTLQAQRKQGLHIFVQIKETDLGEVSINGFRFFHTTDGETKIDEFLRIAPLGTNLSQKEQLVEMLEQEISKEYHKQDLLMEPYTGIMLQKDSQRTADTFWKSIKPIDERILSWLGVSRIDPDSILKVIGEKKGYKIDEQGILIQAFRPEDSEVYEKELQKAKSDLEQTKDPQKRLQKALGYEANFRVKDPFITKHYEWQEKFPGTESSLYQKSISNSIAKLRSGSDVEDLESVLEKWQDFLNNYEIDDPKRSNDNNLRAEAREQIDFLQYGLEMKMAYEQIVNNASDLSPKELINRWENFSAEFSKDMPLQRVDNRWRENASEQIRMINRSLSSNPLTISVGISGQSIDFKEESGEERVEGNSFTGIQIQLRYFPFKRVSLGLSTSKGNNSSENSVSAYRSNGEAVSGSNMSFSALTISYKWGQALDSWLGQSWAIHLGLGYASMSAEWTDGTNMSQGGIALDFGIEYLTASNVLLTLNGVSLSGEPEGSHVEKMRENGLQVKNFSASSAMLGIGYKFD